jgi:hypothetical protein
MMQAADLGELPRASSAFAIQETETAASRKASPRKAKKRQRKTGSQNRDELADEKSNFQVSKHFVRKARFRPAFN